MLRALANNIAIVGGAIILSRFVSQFWQIVIGVILLILGLVTLAVI